MYEERNTVVIRKAPAANRLARNTTRSPISGSQGCRGDGISIPIPIPYPQESPLESPWESPYPRQPWRLTSDSLNDMKTPKDLPAGKAETSTGVI